MGHKIVFLKRRVARRLTKNDFVRLISRGYFGSTQRVQFLRNKYRTNYGLNKLKKHGSQNEQFFFPNGALIFKSPHTCFIALETFTQLQPYLISIHCAWLKCRSITAMHATSNFKACLNALKSRLQVLI